MTSGLSRAELTAQYLDEVKRRGISAGELTSTHPESVGLRSLYGGRFLSRPLFLGAEETEQLARDMLTMRAALVSLPDKLYGGDFAAFGRAVGLNEAQVSAVLRSRGTTVTMQSRGDLYLDETGFKLLEFNMGSALGGIDQSDMATALLDQPVLLEFACKHRLSFVDTMREQVNDMLVECGFAPGSRPKMATVDWPSSYETLEPYMQHFAGRLTEMGIDTVFGHIGQLEVRDGGVWLGDVRLDMIQRLFMLEDLADPESLALAEPILDAAARGEVKIFTPLDAEMFASKRALAMLSDEANRKYFDTETLASLDRILPWTRAVRSGPVTLEDGSQVELIDYVLSHRDELVIKPTQLHGGDGVLLGWRTDTSAELWEERVRAAVDGPWIVQRRIRPLFEYFPMPDGDPEPWVVNWGVYTVVNGYGGVYARAGTVESDLEVIRLYGGASVGCALHVLPEDSDVEPGTALPVR
ncbi:hypothetical protein PWY87_09440 [Kribbella solani]|uniref:hypothetical protein n=1 Tax=Kribbella solani TaxID=236067 RepID=UPI0029B22332|nr:hypothetical protein [Kribbella solani]MDX3001890.1 hypothetical protein [Kribbella solani]